jgi:hypothetical protein
MTPTELAWVVKRMGSKQIFNDDRICVTLCYIDHDGLFTTDTFKNLSWSAHAISRWLHLEFECGYVCWIDYKEFKK